MIFSENGSHPRIKSEGNPSAPLSDDAALIYVVYLGYRENRKTGNSGELKRERLKRERPWRGQPRLSSRSASALRSTATCRPSSDPQNLRIPAREWGD